MPVIINGTEYLSTKEAAALVGRDPATLKWWLAPGRGAERLRVDLQHEGRNYYRAAHIIAFFADKRHGDAAQINRAHRVRRKKAEQ